MCIDRTKTGIITTAPWLERRRTDTRRIPALDDIAFDRLTRLFSASRSRRGAARAVIGTLLGSALLGQNHRARADARKRKGGRRADNTNRRGGGGGEGRLGNEAKRGHGGRKRKTNGNGKGKDKRKDTCTKAGHEPNRRKPCCKGLVRDADSRCAQPPQPTCAQTCAQSGTMCCGSPGTCVDLNTDETNCGTCGNHCLSGEICTNGKCLCAIGKQVCGAACISGCCNQGVEEPCDTDETCCSGHGCMDLQTNFVHCGTCGASCVPDTFTDCVSGECKCGTGPACTGGKICKEDSGECVCPNGGDSCEDSCGSGKVWCGNQCLVCPDPPPGIGLPGDPPPECCPPFSECSCGGRCCEEKGDCFQTFDSRTNEVVKEFCCSEEGGTVCGDQCCKSSSDCASGCIQMFPVGGSYRRPGR